MKSTSAPDNAPASEAYFKSLIENALDIITVLNRRGVIQYESPSIRKTLGYEPDEMVGQQVFHYIHPDDRLHSMKLYAMGEGRAKGPARGSAWLTKWSRGIKGTSILKRLSEKEPPSASDCPPEFSVPRLITAF